MPNYTNTAINKSVDDMKAEDVKRATNALKKAGEMENKYTPRPELKKYMRDRFSGSSGLMARKYIKKVFFGKMKEQKQIEEMLPDGKKKTGESNEPKWLQEKNAKEKLKARINSARQSQGFVMRLQQKRLGKLSPRGRDAAKERIKEIKNFSDAESIGADNLARQSANAGFAGGSIEAPHSVAAGIQAAGVVGGNNAQGLTQESRGVAPGPNIPSSGSSADNYHGNNFINKAA